MSRSAAASTAGACIRPGCRVSRSSGPETDTAAMTLPDGERTGADTEATPASRSPTLCAQPRRRMPDRVVGVELGALQAAVQPVRLLPGEQDLRGGAGEHGQLDADRDRVAQTGRALGGGDADRGSRPGGGTAARDSPVMSRSRASTGPAAASSRSSPAAEASSARRGPSMNRPCMSRATRRWCSSATASRWAVGRASPVAVTRPARVAGPDSRAREYEGGFVEHADSARVVHTSILPSRMLICKFEEEPGRHVAGRRIDERTDREDGTARWRRRSGTRTSSRSAEGEPDLLYIDLHLVHEVTSPQAFEGLRLAGRAGAPPGPDPRDRGPQHPDARRRQADRRPGVAARRSRRCATTPPSSASACTRSATSSRASCTSSARSSA